jgi:hypothetical protein
MSSLNPLKVQLGDNWIFSVPPEDYMIDYYDSSYKLDLCIVGVSGGNYGLFILGDSFLRTFLSIYDFENSRVGIAFHIYSNGTATKKFPTWAIWVIVCSGIVLLLIIVICLCRRRKNAQLKKNLSYYAKVEQKVE